jgi:hypothetical protein
MKTEAPSQALIPTVRDTHASKIAKRGAASIVMVSGKKQKAGRSQVTY